MPWRWGGKAGLASAALCAAAACGKGGAGLGAPVPIEGFGAAYAESYCAFQVRCGQQPDQGRCLKNFAVLWMRPVAQLVTSVEAERLGYDPDAAGICLASVSQLPCTIQALEADADLRALCDRVFAAKVATGGACTISDECADRGRCEMRGCVPGQSCCKGMCAARAAPAALGAACDGLIECVPEAYCDRSGAAVGVCKARVVAGQPCTSATACVSPARCRTVAGGTMTCLLPARDGESCADLQGCRNLANVCDPADRTCKPRLAVGEPCGPESACVAYAACAGGMCQLRPSLGEACAQPDGGAISAGIVPCLAGFCRSGTCTAGTITPACR